MSHDKDFGKSLVSPKDSDSLDQARVALFSERPESFTKRILAVCGKPFGYSDQVLM